MDAIAKLYRNSSMKIWLIVYFVVALAAAYLVNMAADRYLDNIINQQFSPVPDKVYIYGDSYYAQYSDNSDGNFSITIDDKDKIMRIQKIESVLPFIIYSSFTVISALLFYQFKMKKNLRRLKYGIKKIKEKDLDFTIATRKTDELGMICQSFEDMRKELKKTFGELWDEQIKQDNMIRAFSHDIRTPITIIKGNNEVTRLLLNNDADTSKILSTIESSEEAVNRINNYAEVLRKYRDIDEIDINIEKLDYQVLAKKLELQYSNYAKSLGKELIVDIQGTQSISADINLVLLIYERLIENSIRFCNDKVIVGIRNIDENDVFFVEDDGPGFSSEAILHGQEMFYSTDKARGHAGIGLSMAMKAAKRMNREMIIQNKCGSIIYF